MATNFNSRYSLSAIRSKGPINILKLLNPYYDPKDVNFLFDDGRYDATKSIF